MYTGIVGSTRPDPARWWRRTFFSHWHRLASCRPGRRARPFASPCQLKRLAAINGPECSSSSRMARPEVYEWKVYFRSENTSDLLLTGRFGSKQKGVFTVRRVIRWKDTAVTLSWTMIFGGKRFLNAEKQQFMHSYHTCRYQSICHLLLQSDGFIGAQNVYLHNLLSKCNSLRHLGNDFYLHKAIKVFRPSPLTRCHHLQSRPHALQTCFSWK